MVQKGGPQPKRCPQGPKSVKSQNVTCRKKDVEAKKVSKMRLGGVPKGQ